MQIISKQQKIDRKKLAKLSPLEQETLAQLVDLLALSPDDRPEKIEVTFESGKITIGTIGPSVELDASEKGVILFATVQPCAEFATSPEG